MEIHFTLTLGGGHFLVINLLFGGFSKSEKTRTLLLIASLSIAKPKPCGQNNYPNQPWDIITVSKQQF
jgi:hypothetical protein